MPARSANMPRIAAHRGTLPGMPHSRTPAFNPLLAVLSGLSLAAGVIAGIAGLATNSSGGLFPNLALALGLMGLGLGNAVSFLCNLLAWRLGARLRWLRICLLYTSDAADE